MRPCIFAHRGASHDAPENTMAAFQLAQKQGADGIELDVQRTKDGKLVVIHDEKLNRTTNGKGLVLEHTYRELRKLDAGYRFPSYRGERIPLLSDVLSWIRPTNLQLDIELKNSLIPYEDMEEEVINEVYYHGMRERTVLSTFNLGSIGKIVAIDPRLDVGLLFNKMTAPWLLAQQIGAKSLHPSYNGVDETFVRMAHLHGLKVRPYTVNKVPDMQRMISFGVNAIMTDVPLRLKKILQHER